MTDQKAARAALPPRRDRRARNDERERNFGLIPLAARDQALQPSVRALAYGQLQRAIVTCAIEPGARLSEKSIAQAYGVSRTPVGEALQQLATDGLVLIRPQQRTVVSRISASRVQEACFVAELVGRIAVGAINDTAVHSHREFLKALLREQQATAETGDVSSFLDSALQFSAEVVGLSGLTSLQDVARSAQAHLGRVLALSSPNVRAIRDWSRDNLELFEALLLRDAARAGNALCSRSEKTIRLLPELAARHPGFFDGEDPPRFQLQLRCLSVTVRSTEGLDT